MLSLRLLRFRFVGFFGGEPVGTTRLSAAFCFAFRAALAAAMAAARRAGMVLDCSHSASLTPPFFWLPCIASLKFYALVVPLFCLLSVVFF